MSMILCFVTVSDQTIGRLRAHPKQVEQIISHEEDWADGEEGNLVEKVIIEQNPSPTPAEQAAAETTDAAHPDGAQQVETDEKST